MFHQDPRVAARNFAGEVRWRTEEFGVRTGLVVTGAPGMVSAGVIGLLRWVHRRRRNATA